MPLRPLPVLGRQVRSFDAQSGATMAVLEAGITALQRVQREVPEEGGLSATERSTVLRTVRDVAGALDTAIASADLGPSEGLVSLWRAHATG